MSIIPSNRSGKVVFVFAILLFIILVGIIGYKYYWQTGAENVNENVNQPTDLQNQNQESGSSSVKVQQPVRIDPEDIYGGITPGGTLAGFIQALADDDFSTAIRYMIPENQVDMRKRLEDMKAKKTLSLFITNLRMVAVSGLPQTATLEIKPSKNQPYLIQFSKTSNGTWKIVKIEKAA